MSNLFSHAAIQMCDDNVQKRFIPSGLEKIDNLKVVLEQAIYLQYLELTVGKTTSILDLRRSISAMFSELTSTTAGTGDPAEEKLYAEGYKTAYAILYSDHLDHDVSLRDIRALFATRDAKQYYNSLYTATMTSDFLDQWLAMHGYVDVKCYPDGIMKNATLYLPKAVMCYAASSENIACGRRVAIVLCNDDSAFNQINLDLNKINAVKCLYCFLEGFDLKRISISALFCLLASFTIDHDNYVMTNSARVADICFDVITGSSYYKFLECTGTDEIVDLEQFITLLNKTYTGDELWKDFDYEIFGDFLARLGEEDQELIKYFTTDASHITNFQAESFENSVFASFIPSKLTTVMEDSEEEVPDNSDAQPDLGGTDESFGNDSKTTDVPDTTDTPETPEPEVKTQIDPNAMLLELASADDSMSDYIYRETISRRISSILNNPPENVRPNDLIMLKRWKSRWLYLASISCLRDFLTRISIRLSV